VHDTDSRSSSDVDGLLSAVQVDPPSALVKMLDGAFGVDDE
jgi:hypothetical protein